MGGGAAGGENEDFGWEGLTLMLEIASAFLVCGEWKSSYSQPHNGTLTARIVARGGDNLAAFGLSA